jgi:SAM-dependent methyltransferase
MSREHLEGDTTALAPDSLFDHYVDEYEDACQRGLSLSGESREYFAAQRVAHTARWLAQCGAPAPGRVADFGCGLGHSAPHLRRHFPEAEVLGLDTSAGAIARARQLHGGGKNAFAVVTDHAPAQDRQLVYCNGVFHHIPPAERSDWAAYVHGLLAPGGHFALWENNPWNPGTRLVMRRIPFDRDAVPVPPPEARRLLAGAGFLIVGTRYRFYFPRCLRWLRCLEPPLARLPLGAQYCVLARKQQPGSSSNPLNRVNAGW